MENNYLEDFINNPVSQKLLKDFENILCNNVTMISSTCDEIVRLNKKSGSKEVGELLEYINRLCFGIIRLSDCNATLLRMSGEECEDFSMKNFLKSFADRCNEVTGKACPVRISGNAGLNVRTNKEILRRAMLEFIRNYGLMYGRGTEFEIRCADDDGNVSVFVEVVRYGRPDEFSEKYDVSIFKDYCDEINRMFSEKSGTEYTYGDDFLKVTMPCISGESIVLTDDSAVIDRGDFSEYNTMLTDLSYME